MPLNVVTVSAYCASDYRTGAYEVAEIAAPVTTSTDKSRGVPIAFSERTRKDGRSLESLDDFLATVPRRLTPRECERLQGFPDDWTRYAADGSEIADSPRYRMLGNAVTVSVSEWIGRSVMEAASAPSVPTREDAE
jgi:DNA (cytosine-5)-methyltransferase 1